MTTNTMNTNKKTYIANAFSLQMITDFPVSVTIEEVPISVIEEVGKVGNLMSAIGHPDTAAVVSNMLGIPLPANRVNVALSKGDEMFVAQLQGGRLPEGATTLPEGFKLKFLRVKVGE